MTRDEYLLFAGDDLDVLEGAAATKNMTGQELVESLLACSVQKLKEIGNKLGSSSKSAITQVSGNVIQVNFSARAAASWNGRTAHKEPSKRRQFANRVILMPIRVPSTAPSANSSAVPSTSPGTVIPYSGF